MEIGNGNRYEIKMVYDGLRIFEVRQWIRNHSSAFHKAYSTRLVSNVYYDTEELGAFNDHISGSSSRQKMRFRWYYDKSSLVDGQLEIKRKDARVGSKIIQKIRGIDLEHDTWRVIQQKMLAQSSEQIHLLVKSTFPVSINTYQRDYFVSADGITRVTLDYQMKAWDQRVYASPNMRNAMPQTNTMVIEFKRDMYGHEDFADILAEFPLRVTNYSKYVSALDGILGW
jgi:hypothetical protein